jgi:RNA polymerase sigma-70 factor, ECF subfamily
LYNALRVSDPSALPDIALWVARLAAGDREAEAELVARFQPRIRVMMRARVRDAELARDLTQETLLAVVVALRKGQLREPSRLTAFVHGVARNIANGHLRGTRRLNEQPLETETLAVPADDDVESRDRQQVVARGLAAIPREDRDILLLTLVEGLAPRQIAERLSVSADVVRQRKSRALKRIIAAVMPLPGMSRPRPL